MLEYCKTILQKVSFDSNLFEKELRKAVHYINPNELKDFLAWVHLNYGKEFADVISRFDKFL